MSTIIATGGFVPALAGGGEGDDATYLSLGNSYAQGYQPCTDDTTEGFVYLRPAQAEAKGYELRLANYGCGGATIVGLTYPDVILGAYVADDPSATYGDLTDATTVEPYGEIPTPVARVCQLTWFCERQDIHRNKDGYARMAELITEALPTRR